ncbi:carboxypeptidase regulatory-like domain-containing protein [Gimesia benthica]|uniref:Carboxypeptidase regulatory-like domain-containing protein n=1 Tax=Gimesia benthica TaxID=2608982 RepID=A0A6I6A9I1_9PLAN|nr:carboxypeptidase-like regulatory domain-containing protein [Gimesia benthica]QGQ22025.1 carboxypeptidase regulatory-like domain-containing protein [Gimesia benthica]
MKFFLSQNKLHRLCFLCLLCSTVLVGCSQSPSDDKQRSGVTISISFAGEPVTTGSVNLENSETGESGGGELNADGSVTISNIVLGNYTVTILPPDPDPVPPEPGQPAKKMEVYKNIPEKFRNRKTSPLKVEVKDGENEFQFDLKTAG